MNKYLKLIKSEKRPEGEGSKGSKAPCEPLEPSPRDTFSEFMRPALSENRPSEPFEPAPDGHIEKNASAGGLVCDGALYADGPYLPWGPYINCVQLASMQRDLLAAVEELARLERWPDEYFDHVAYCIERQPISTLRPDLAHFAERLRVTRAEETARLAASRRAWKYDR